jgi:hypothetical protein
MVPDKRDYGRTSDRERPGRDERHTCFRGTRVPFENLIDYLEGGHSLSEFLRQALEEAKESLFARIA